MSKDYEPKLKESICQDYDENPTVTVYDLADAYGLPVEDIKSILLE